jgi:hypothetical protein
MHALNHIKSTRPSATPVFNTYWRFAAERQEIFLRRLKGAKRPWTSDQVLREYKFTNAYRASDRVSQYLIRHVIYSGSQAPDEVVFRILLFKFFNRIETWELLRAHVGAIEAASFDEKRYSSILAEALTRGERIYSAAYIIPPVHTDAPQRYKHDGHLGLIARMLRERVPERIASCDSMESGFQLLRSYPSVGDFLAYQYLIDINYSEVISFDESEFVMPGPGARDGIRKCFYSNEFVPSDLIKHVADSQEREFERLGLTFRTLWGRPLQLIDCQNLFCEVDKYARVRHPEAVGVSGRTRIKQRYKEAKAVGTVWYPPKWGINRQVMEWQSADATNCAVLG